MPEHFVVHYSEVALKGKNRPEFVRLLRRNISRALWGLEPSIDSRDGRLLVSASGSRDEVAKRLSRVFGVAWFAPASLTSASFDGIKGAVLAEAKQSSAATFKIDPKRSDKTFALGSYELASKLGELVIEETGKTVDLSNPGLRVHVDVIRNGALVYSAKQKGPGGLPVGSAGKVMHLFSGGIDSPAAAWLLMKRGCRPVYLHFYLAPTPEYPLQSKVVRLVKALSQYGGRSTLVLIPFAEYQLGTTDAPGDLEPSLFRRFMRMTAEVLAPHFEALAISTGDSLSQAASQTLWNMRTFDEGTTLPILRPLLTYDKEEIITLAKAIGTYEPSLEEYKDCCAIVTRHPKTRARATVISDYAEALKFSDLVRKSIAQGTLATYSPAGDAVKANPLADALRRGTDDPDLRSEAEAETPVT